MRPPTERQAVLAARQLHYHRERLRWIRGRMRDNEALLSLYLMGLEDPATVLPGGYRISGDHASPDRDVASREVIPSGPLRTTCAAHRRTRDRQRGDFPGTPFSRSPWETSEGSLERSYEKGGSVRLPVRGKGVSPLPRWCGPRRISDGGEDRCLPRLQRDRKSSLLPLSQAEGSPRTVAAERGRSGRTAHRRRAVTTATRTTETKGPS